MTIYQKAIKVRKVCESRQICKDKSTCPYIKQCSNSIMFYYTPACSNIETIAKTIKNEKWNVK